MNRTAGNAIHLPDGAIASRCASHSSARRKSPWKARAETAMSAGQFGSGPVRSAAVRCGAGPEWRKVACLCSRRGWGVGWGGRRPGHTYLTSRVWWRFTRLLEPIKGSPKARASN